MGALELFGTHTGPLVGSMHVCNTQPAVFGSAYTEGFWVKTIHSSHNASYHVNGDGFEGFA